MRFSSRLLEEVVQTFNSLPGVGRKSALRMALHLMKKDEDYTLRFADAILKAKREIQECERCHNYADQAICAICSNQKRDSSILCLVEGTRDIMAIEDTNQYSGVYHVLGGVISPIDGIGPADLNMASLLRRIQDDNIREIIMAINPTIEGETTIYYVSKQVQPFGIPVSVIARGVAFGGELEYADELTLGRSILARTPYQLQART